MAEKKVSSTLINDFPLVLKLLENKEIKTLQHGKSFIRAVVLLLNFQNLLAKSKQKLKEKEQKKLEEELNGSDDRLFESGSTTVVSDGDVAMIAALPSPSTSTPLMALLDKARKSLLESMDWYQILPDPSSPKDIATVKKHHDLSRVLRLFSGTLLQANKPYAALKCHALLIRLNPGDKAPIIEMLSIACILGLWTFAYAAIQKLMPKDSAKWRVSDQLEEKDALSQSKARPTKTQNATKSSKTKDSESSNSNVALKLLQLWIHLHVMESEKSLSESLEQLLALQVKIDGLSKGFDAYRLQIILRLALSDAYLLEAKVSSLLYNTPGQESSPLTFLDEALYKSMTVVRSTESQNESQQNTSGETTPSWRSKATFDFKKELGNPAKSLYIDYVLVSLDLFIHINITLKLLENYHMSGLARDLSVVLDEGFKLVKKVAMENWLKPYLKFACRLAPEIGTPAKQTFYRNALDRVNPDSSETARSVFGASSDDFSDLSQTSEQPTLEMNFLKDVEESCEYLGIKLEDKFTDECAYLSYAPTRLSIAKTDTFLDQHSSDPDQITFIGYILKSELAKARRTLDELLSSGQSPSAKSNDSVESLSKDFGDKLGISSKIRINPYLALQLKLKKLIKKFGHLMFYPVRRQLFELLAEVQNSSEYTGKETEKSWDVVWALTESLGVGLRERARMMSTERWKNKGPEPKKPSPFTLVPDPSSLKQFTSGLPEDWKVVQLQVPFPRTDEEDCGTVFWISILMQDGVFYFQRTLAKEDYELLLEMKVLDEENVESMDIKDRLKFWGLRKKLNFQLEKILSQIQEKWFGEMVHLLHGSWLASSEEKGPVSRADKALKLLSWPLTHRKVLMDAVIGTGIEAKARDSLVSALAQSVKAESIKSRRSSFCDHDKTIKILAALQKSIVLAPTVRRERGPVSFIFSNELLQIPWECLPIFVGPHLSLDDTEGDAEPNCPLTPMSRSPSLHFFLKSLELLKENERQTIDNDSVFYIVNPSRDLVRTEQFFAPIFTKKDKWKGEIGRIPPTTAIKEALEDRDLLIYCGHGNMSKLISSSVIRHSLINAVALLMGCDSARMLSRSPKFEPYGTVTEYELASCPCVVGCLWKVTDRDIDKYCLALLETWMSLQDDTAEKKGLQLDRQLLTSMARARRSCKLKYLTGAAIVGYGLPVICGQKSSSFSPKPTASIPPSSTRKSARSKS